MDEETVRRRLLRDDVVEWTSARIIDGSLRPGAQLTIRSLSQKLQVSPAPIRDALSILAARGLIELTPRRSARVCTFEEAAGDAAVALGVLMGGVVSVSIHELSPAALRYATETVRETINALARPADYDLRAVAIEGYQRWATICANQKLGAILAARSAALAVESTTANHEAAQPLITIALHALDIAIDSRNPVAARAAITAMHHQPRSGTATLRA